MSSDLILFNKPFHVVCQFSLHETHRTLKTFIPLTGYYPAGRLDHDSEGLLLLTNNGRLQHTLSDPAHKTPKTYWVQVEGEIDQSALDRLQNGLILKDGITRPAIAKAFTPPQTLWERSPPVRFRQNIPTSWISLTITEGRNRQVRRMTAAVGYPTLRLIRYSIGEWSIDSLLPGEWKLERISPQSCTQKRDSRNIRAVRNK
jgi:23S rRNA pseudouridine2457 synthase